MKKKSKRFLSSAVFGVVALLLMSCVIFNPSDATAGVIAPPVIDVHPTSTDPGGAATVEIGFTANSNLISATTFSIDFDENLLDFDPAIGGYPNAPAAVDVLSGCVSPSNFIWSVGVTYDAADTTGELDISILDSNPPLTPFPEPCNYLMRISFTAKNPSTTSTAFVNCSNNPPLSFGNTDGQSVPGECNNGSVLIEVACTPTGTPETICNGVDDDCDGSIDEDYQMSSTTCGVGVCAATGQTTCVEGVEGDTCAPGNPTGTPETICNGADDDCDGSTDEDYQMSSTTCGVGVCAATGQTTCVEGVEGDTCAPGNPTGTPETICNGADDDCDGSTDEDYQASGTTCGVGVCAATGQTTCVEGVEGDTCAPGNPTGTPETICNGADDDCDGSTDEDYQASGTTCGVGVCAATGQTTCVEGVEGDTCQPLPSGVEGPPNDPNCSDQADNDCDGLTDLAEDPDCQDDFEANCFDGIDNDGDGPMDCADPDCEGVTDGACNTTLPGVCGPGTVTCRGGTEVCEQNVQPSAEVCDGLDNDCNSAVDEGFNVGAACSIGLGECARDGVMVCNAAGAAECNVVPGNPSAEVCDGLDNDCDGPVDEDLGTTTCGTGECEVTVDNCIGGEPQVCVSGDPTAEVCDSLDNDCDGPIDEELGTTTCGLGACEVTVDNCIDGVPQECVAGDPGVEGPPNDPNCDDQIDNDCDDATDLEDPDCEPGLGPMLAIPDRVPAVCSEQVTVPIQLVSNGNNISATVFSLDYDESVLSFDPTSTIIPGIPDAVTFNIDLFTFGVGVNHDQADTDGELDFSINDNLLPLSALPDGTIVSVTFDVGIVPDNTESFIMFSLDPMTSFGNTQGQSVEGTTSGGSVDIECIDDVCPPDMQPVGDLMTRAKSGKVTLMWSCMPGATGYDVYRANETMGFELIAADHQSDYCTYSDDSVSNGHTYQYFVRWLMDVCESPDSNDASATPTAERIRR